MEITRTKRLLIRLLTADDAAMILQLLNEPAFLTNIGDKGVSTLNEALNYINTGPLAMQKSLGFSLYCCQLLSTGQAIGLSGLIKREGVEQPEVGFAFLNRFCGQGYGYESAAAVIKHAKTRLGLKQLQAICNRDNQASIGLLTKLGFVYQQDIFLPGEVEKIKLFELC